MKGLRLEVKKDEYKGMRFSQIFETIRSKVVDGKKPFEKLTTRLLTDMRDGLYEEPDTFKITSKNPKHIVKIPATHERISIKIPMLHTDLVVIISAESSDTGQEGTYYKTYDIARIIIPPETTKFTAGIKLPTSLKRYIRLTATPHMKVKVVANTVSVGS